MRREKAREYLEMVRGDFAARGEAQDEVAWERNNKPTTTSKDNKPTTTRGGAALDETLEEHDKKYHPEGYKEGDECNKRAEMAKEDKADKDISLYAFADTDTSFDKPTNDDIKDDSLVIVAGDVDVSHMRKMCKDNPNKMFLAIHGNHRMWNGVSQPNFRVLSDEMVDVNGLKVFGLDYVPRWTNRDAKTDAKQFSKIPEGLDILITHMPPRIEGSNIDWSDSSNEHLGSVELTNEILKKKPKLVLCGHIHGGSKDPVEIGESTVWNCALYDGYSKDKGYRGSKIRI